MGSFSKDWQVVELKDITEHIMVGIASAATHAYRNKGIILFRNQNIKEGYLDDTDILFIDVEYEKIHKNKRLKEGDLLIARTGYPGTACVVPKKYIDAQSFTTLIVRPKPSEINNQFLCYYINSPLGKAYFESTQIGGGQKNVNAGSLELMPIPVPNIAEQTAIAQVLSTWDKAINTLTQLIAQKELRKKWLMQQLLTGKKRLKGFSKAWKEVRLREIFNEISDVNDGANTHSVMTISSRIGFISQEDKFDRVIAGDSLKKYTQLKRNDFAYNKGNSKTYQMGCIYQLEEKESALVPFVYICFSPTELIDPKFYKHWFLAHGLDRQLNRIITSGARGDGLLNVNTDDFFGLKVPHPPKEEQTAIANVLQSADAELNLLRQKLDKLKEQKKGLMQVLLTGKKRLKF